MQALRFTDCTPNIRHRMQVLVMLLVSMTFGTADAEVSHRVVTSIKPVHSLVSAVMAGVDEPYLLIRGAASPHAFSLRPSDAMKLKNARVVFLVGKSMEISLINAVQALSNDARVIMLFEAPGLVRKRLREGGTFETYTARGNKDTQAGGHVAPQGDDPEQDKDHAPPHDDEHTDTHVSSHGEEGHDSGDHASDYDMHIWLDPVNAAVMTRLIAATLSESDPANAEIFARNSRALLHRLETLASKITEQMKPAQNKPFIVLHDAYRYFEDRFGLSAAGSIVVGSEQSPSVRRIQGLRDKIHELGAICVFAEPQFDSRLVDIITEGTQARFGRLDPLGAALDEGPDAYFMLLNNMAESFRECLDPAG